MSNQQFGQQPYQENPYEQGNGGGTYGQQPLADGPGMAGGMAGGQAPAGGPANYGTQPLGYVQPKSRVVAGLLGLFLGCWGVHNFYVGRTAVGLIQLALTAFSILTSWLLIGLLVLPVVAVWAFIEAILAFMGAGPYQTDSRGVPLV